MLLDELERLGVDDGRHDVGERLAHDAAHLCLLPALRQRQHRLAHASQPGLVGPEIEVHELAPQAAHEQPSRAEPVSVEGTPKRHHRRPCDHGLVEVEERRFHDNRA